MHYSKTDIRQKLVDKGLKVTPQRMAILEAVLVLDNHPTAESIIEYVRENQPGIATGTVYKVLDALEQSMLIRKVKTDKDIKRYDGILEKHHHLYCNECEEIRDYNDPELDLLLEKHFKDKNIPDFTIEDFAIQIKGRFIKH